MFKDKPDLWPLEQRSQGKGGASSPQFTYRCEWRLLDKARRPSSPERRRHRQYLYLRAAMFSFSPSLPPVTTADNCGNFSLPCWLQQIKS